MNKQEEIRKNLEAWDAKFSPENINKLCEELLASKVVKTKQEAHDYLDVVYTIIRQSLMQGEYRFSIKEYADRIEKLQWFNESCEKNGRYKTIITLFPQTDIDADAPSLVIEGFVKLIRESIIYGAFDVKKARKSENELQNSLFMKEENQNDK